MDQPRSPVDWAMFVNQVLDQAFGRERHPISVIETAQLFSKIKFPDESISIVQGADLPGFQGMLIPDPRGRKGWGIFFNHSVKPRTRVRFTLAHEFGHYLLHRHQKPAGFQCRSDTMPEYGDVASRQEHEANLFASHLLMPLHDFQSQISPDEMTDLNMLSFMAQRYGVSLMAIIRHWLSFTLHPATLVISREGYILWSISSQPAIQTGMVFPVHNDPVAIPVDALAAHPHMINYPKEGALMSAGTWFSNRDVVEMVIYSERYDLVISLLLSLSDQPDNPAVRS
ncbi:MAG: ImmA/IrrE family metallo-endopeptidase [Magnetococcales bacterium]|nr:ImmA/IrrE family metallo-endopeptidase [Magnetococcales bacterium]